MKKYAGIMALLTILTIIGVSVLSQNIETKRSRLTKFSQLHTGSFAGLVLSATDSTIVELYDGMIPTLQVINGDLDARKIEEIISQPAAISPGRTWLQTKFTGVEIQAFIDANKVP